MTTYHRIRYDEDSSDAVTVAIGGETDDEFTVSVMWPERILAGRRLKPGILQPDTVEEALAEAQRIARQYAFSRVVVMLQRDSLWREEWGLLI